MRLLWLLGATVCLLASTDAVAAFPVAGDNFYAVQDGDNGGRFLRANPAINSDGVDVAEKRRLEAAAAFDKYAHFFTKGKPLTKSARVAGADKLSKYQLWKAKLLKKLVARGGQTQGTTGEKILTRSTQIKK